MNAVEFINVQKDYKDGEAVAGVSMQVPEGAFVVIMGASGSGKTTLLKMVNRLVIPSSGSVLFFGQDNSEFEETALRRQIGYVLQAAALFPHRTVAQNIATVPEILGWPKSKVQQRVEELLVMVGLPPEQYARRHPSQLSGGQQQRVSLARAMAASPKVLLMDEPFGALDVIIRARLQNDLLRLHRQDGSTILFVTHDVDEAFRLGDMVAIMNNGHLVQYGQPAQLLANPADEYVSQLLGFLSVDAVNRAGGKL